MTSEIPEVPGLTDLSPLGRGGLADVYLARQGHLQRWVAAKVFRVTLADEQAAERFRAECSAIGRLDQYPHVLTVYDAGVLPDGRPYLISERCDGSLSDLVEMRGPLPADRVAALGSTIARALRHAHSAGVLHGDVTPQNLLLRTSGAPVLADFGLAVLRDHAPTAAGFTLLHAAPEALRAGTVIDERADVYGLGSTLYTVLTGEPPFPPQPDEDADSYRRRVRNLPPPRPHGAPDQLAGLLVAMLAADPSHRPSTDEVVAALQTAPGRTTTPSDDGLLTATRPDTGYDSIAVPAHIPATSARTERRRWGVPGARRRAGATPAPRASEPGAAKGRPISRTVWATRKSGDTQPDAPAARPEHIAGATTDGASAASSGATASAMPVPGTTAERAEDPPVSRSEAVGSAGSPAPAGSSTPTESAAPSVAAALASYAARTGWTSPAASAGSAQPAVSARSAGNAAPAAPATSAAHAGPAAPTATVAPGAPVPPAVHPAPTARRSRIEPVDQDTRVARAVDQDMTAVDGRSGRPDVLIDAESTARTSVPVSRSAARPSNAVRPAFVSLTVSPPTVVPAPADRAESDPAATRVMAAVGPSDAGTPGTEPGAVAADPIEQDRPAAGPESSTEDTRVLMAWVSGLEDPPAELGPAADPVRIPGRPRRRRQRRALIAAGSATAVLVTGAGVGAVWRSLDQTSPSAPDVPVTPNVVAAPGGASARAVEVDLPRGPSGAVTGEALAEAALPGVTRPGGTPTTGPAARSVAPRPATPRTSPPRAATPANPAPQPAPRPPAARAPVADPQPEGAPVRDAEGRATTVADDGAAGTGARDRPVVDRSGPEEQSAVLAR